MKQEQLLFRATHWARIM